MQKNSGKKVKEEEKGKAVVGQSKPELVKVAGVVYGTKDLAGCMESVIKLYMDR